MTLLVTGATGFIGGHLARHLAACGEQVRALVHRDCPELAAHGIELATGDVADRLAIGRALHGVDAVFHLAGQRDEWNTDPCVYHQVNVAGTRNLLSGAAGANVRSFIYCSSVGVARYAGNLAADETLPYAPASSQAAYHETKAKAEQEALAAAQSGQVPALVVRPVITYGPGDTNGMVTQLLKRLAARTFLPVGRGDNHVDLAYIDDMVAGMVLAWRRGRPGRVYILSGPQPCRMRDVLAAARATLGQGPPGAFYVPSSVACLAADVAERLFGAAGRRPPLTRDAVATLTVDRGFSHARAQKELGYEPQINLEEGLRRTWAWVQAADETKRAPVQAGK
ncbi:MAG: NAD-dependent epimerase/dehydratase family protein [Anaerolineae bacterium]|nr:NAD-dependent epimerase/dehydratase family protein [Anaerolineae bacterium]